VWAWSLVRVPWVESLRFNLFGLASASFPGNLDLITVLVSGGGEASTSECDGVVLLGVHWVLLAVGRWDFSWDLVVDFVNGLEVGWLGGSKLSLASDGSLLVSGVPSEDECGVGLVSNDIGLIVVVPEFVGSSFLFAESDLVLVGIKGDIVLADWVDSGLLDWTVVVGVDNSVSSHGGHDLEELMVVLPSVLDVLWSVGVDESFGEFSWVGWCWRSKLVSSRISSSGGSDFSWINRSINLDS
jgi:hypothetical protein